jgi:hypothetical protein
LQLSGGRLSQSAQKKIQHARFLSHLPSLMVAMNQKSSDP